MKDEPDQFDGFVLPDGVTVFAPEQVEVVWDLLERAKDLDRFTRDSFGLANLAHECGYHVRLQSAISQSGSPHRHDGPNSPLALLKDRSRS